MSGERAFPLPADPDDPRFTFGLTLDVAKVLVAHGYPDASANSGDFVALQQALFGVLYGREEGP